MKFHKSQWKRVSAEALEPRRLFTGSISGQVFNDLNNNSINDGEPGLSGRIVYLDQNRNHQRDAGELFATTDATGHYTISNLAPGTYYVAQELPLGWQATSPGQSGQISSGPALSPIVPAMTYTGSDEKVSIQGDVASDDVSASDEASSELIRLTNMRSDPRLAGIDGHGFSIAVLDTGIDVNHPFFGPDLDNNGIADRIVYQHDFVNNDNDASDDNGHGSNVASIAASSDPTYTGMAPGANIIALKVLDANGSGSFSYIEQALQWVVANATTYNIAAVNMSLGDNQNYNTPQQLDGINDELAALAAENVIVVSAAGNSYYENQSQGVAYPAADPNSLAVGAVYDADVGSKFWSDGAYDLTTGPDRIASFSHRSTTMMDVFAPGGVITGANNTGGTVSDSGTSQASPHIAGLAVLAQQMAMQALGRRLTPAEFTSLLRSTGTTIFDGDDENDDVANTDQAYPRVDALNLMSAIWGMDPSHYSNGYNVTLAVNQQKAGIDFGASAMNLTPTAAPTLLSECDSGVSPNDDVTNFDNSTPANALQYVVKGTIAGATVEIYSDSTLIGSAVGSAGITLVTTNGTSDIPDGSHSITARQSIPSLGESGPSAGQFLLVDTIAPAAPPAPDLQASRDSGASNTDNITNITTPVFGINSGGALYWRVSENGAQISSPYLSGTQYSPPPQFDETATWTLNAVDAAGNVSAASAALTVTIDTLASPAAPGRDPSFGSGGIVQVANSLGLAALNSAMQSDGKIVIVGLAGGTGPDDTNPFIMRTNADGTVDTTFGNAGLVYPNVGYGRFNSVQLLSGGKILVGGWISPNKLVALRLLSNGQLDTTFGSGGVLTASMAVTDDFRGQIAIDTLGRILLAGPVFANGNDNFGVTRYTAAGAIDTTFGTSGVMTTNVTGGGVFSAMTVAPDNSVVMVGEGSGTSPFDLLVIKLTSGGKLDTSFAGGQVISSMPGNQNLWAVGVQPDNKIVVGGQSDPQNGMPDTVFLAARFNTNGTLDTTFNGGIVTGGPDPYFNGIYNLTIQSDGKILLPLNCDAYGVVRLNSNGTFDASFANNGSFKLASPANWGGAFSAMPKSDGTVTIVGNTGYQQADPESITIVRLTPGQTLSPLSLDPASDTGASSSDRLTNDNTPTFDLPTLPTGSYFEVYRDGTLISAAYASGTTFTAPHQTDGTHEYTLVAIDAAGNSSLPSSAIGVTIDTAAPAINSQSSDFLSTRGKFVFNFTKDVGSSLAADDFVVKNLATSQALDPSLLAFSYDPASRRATFNLPASVADGNYQASLNTLGVTDAAGNALASDGSTGFFLLTGDANRDGLVNALDFNALASNFGHSGANLSMGDFNYDGIVSTNDFLALAAHFAQTANPPSTSLPLANLGATTRTSLFSQDPASGLLDDRQPVLSLLENVN